VRTLVALLLLSFATEGHTSYHSSVSKSYPGLTVSVGFSDFGDQPGGPPLDEIRAGAQARLERIAPRVHSLYTHFATAEHGFRRLRGLLSHEKSYESYCGFAVQVMVENGSVDGWVHLKKRPAESVAAKLAFDFALSQLAPGGAAAKPGHTRDDQIGSSLTGTVMFDPSTTNAASAELGLEYLRERQDSLRALADGPDLKDEAARGQWVARAYLAAFDGKAYSPKLWEQLASFNAEEQAHGWKLLVLLLPDAQWESGVAAVKKHAKGNPEFATWLDPLLKAR
jgi:hypothetical protein